MYQDKKRPIRIGLVCGKQDLNLHGKFPLIPETSASANSAISASK